MWHLYILQCSDNSYYVGSTSDLNQRLSDHKNHKGSFYLRSRLLVTLIYEEKILTKQEAFRREKQIKKWSRTKKEALIEGNLEKLRILSRSRD